MERQMGLFGIADFVVKQNRNRATFLDGVSAMINWKRVDKVLRLALGRNQEPRAGVKAYHGSRLAQQASDRA